MSEPTIITIILTIFVLIAVSGVTTLVIGEVVKKMGSN